MVTSWWANGADVTADYGQFDFDRAFYKSSNAYFIHYGLKLGMNNIIRWGDQFFLGQETGLLPGQEASGFSLPPPWWPRDGILERQPI